MCLEPTPRKFKNGNKCSHPFCTDCVIKYIRVQLDDNNIGDIRCPAVDCCDHTLDPVACASAVGPALFVRWCDVLCESAISGLDKWYCPDRNCNALTVDECAGKLMKKAKCPHCNKLFCFKCKGVWHGKFGCGRKNSWDMNDVVLRNLAEEMKWKRCPRCSQVVELREGCSSVKCRCGIRFCYDCGREGSSHWCICMASHVRTFREIFLGMWLMVLSAGIFLHHLISGLKRRAGF